MEFDLRQRALPVAFFQLHQKHKKALPQLQEGFTLFTFKVVVSV